MAIHYSNQGFRPYTTDTNDPRVDRILAAQKYAEALPSDMAAKLARDAAEGADFLDPDSLYSGVIGGSGDPVEPQPAVLDSEEVDPNDNNVDDWGPFAAIKGVSRVAFTLLGSVAELPVHGIQALGGRISGDYQGEDFWDGWDDYVGSISAVQLAKNWDNQGDGWLYIGGEALEAQEADLTDLWYEDTVLSDGQTARVSRNMGDAAADVLFEDGSAAHAAVEGLVNVGLYVALDPTTYVPLAGWGKGAVKAGKILGEAAGEMRDAGKGLDGFEEAVQVAEMSAKTAGDDVVRQKNNLADALGVDRNAIDDVLADPVKLDAAKTTARGPLVDENGNDLFEVIDTAKQKQTAYLTSRDTIAGTRGSINDIRDRMGKVMSSREMTWQEKLQQVHALYGEAETVLRTTAEGLDAAGHSDLVGKAWRHRTDALGKKRDQFGQRAARAGEVEDGFARQMLDEDAAFLDDAVAGLIPALDKRAAGTVKRLANDSRAVNIELKQDVAASRRMWRYSTLSEISNRFNKHVTQTEGVFNDLERLTALNPGKAKEFAETRSNIQALFNNVTKSIREGAPKAQVVAHQKALRDVLDGTRKKLDNELSPYAAERKAAEQSLGTLGAERAVGKDLLDDVTRETQKNLTSAAKHAAKEAQAAASKQNKQLKAAQKRLDLVRQAEEALTASRRVAAESGSAADVARQALRAPLEAMEKVNTADPSVVAEAIFGSKRRGRKIMQVLADVESPTEILNMSGRRFNPVLAGRLARAKTPEEVQRVLTLAYNADVNGIYGVVNSFGLRAKTVAMVASSEDASRMSRILGKPAETFVRYYSDVQARSPFGKPFDLSDSSVAVPMFIDNIEYMFRRGPVAAKEADQAIARKWGDALINAEYGTYNGVKYASPALARRKVIQDAYAEIGEHYIKTRGLPEEAAKVWSDRLKNLVNEAGGSRPPAKGRKTATETGADYNPFEEAAAARAEAIGDSGTGFVGRDGELIDPLGHDIPHTVSQMRHTMQLPDPRALKDMVRRGAKIMEEEHGLAKWHAVVDKYFNEVFRTAVLAFRISYIIRNIGEMAFRDFLNGSLSDTRTTLAMALDVSGTNRFKKFRSKYNRYSHDLNDVDFGDYDELSQGAEAAMFEQMLGRGAAIDTGDFMGTAVKAGARTFGVADEGFSKAWAQNVILRGRDPILGSVLRYHAEGRLPKHVESWAATKGITDADDAMVEYFWSGPGKKHLDMLRTERPDQWGELLGTAGDEAFGKANVRTMLLDLNNPKSWAATAATMTLDFNPTIVDAFTSLGKGARKSPSQNTRVLSKSMDKLIADGTVSSKSYYQDMRAWAHPDDVMVGAGKQTAGEWVKGWTDRFFDFEGRIEAMTNFAPHTRMSYWRKVETMWDSLSPAEQRKALKIAEKSLKPINRGGRPDDMATKLYNSLEARTGSGKGSMTLDEVHPAAARTAAEDTKRFYYNAKNAGQQWMAMRLILPFGAAWANTLQSWSQLAVKGKGPKRVWQLLKSYEVLATPVIPFNPETMEPLDLPDSVLQTSPQLRSFIYTDPKFGSQVFRVPILPEVLGKLTGGDPELFDVVLPVNSLNLAFGSEMPVLPGAGPAVTVPFKMGQQWFNVNTPEWVDKWLDPYASVEEQGLLETTYDSLMPAWSRRILAAFAPASVSPDLQKMVGPISNSLLAAHPERFVNDAGVMDADGQKRLVDAATAVARTMSLYRGALQSVSPGALVYKWQVETNDGNHPAQEALVSHFWELVKDNGGDFETATTQWVDAYGVDPIMTIAPNYQNEFSNTTEAWDFIQANPEVAEQFPDVVGMLWSEGETSVEMARWRLAHGNSEAMSAEDRIAYRDSMLYSVYKASMDRQVEAGEITEDEAKETMAFLRDEYGVRYESETEMGSSGEKLRRLRDLVSSGAAAETASGQVVSAAIRLYDEADRRAGGSLGTEANTELRYWVYEQIQTLKEQQPTAKKALSVIERELGM